MYALRLSALPCPLTHYDTLQQSAILSSLSSYTKVVSFSSPGMIFLLLAARFSFFLCSRRCCLSCARMSVDTTSGEMDARLIAEGAAALTDDGRPAEDGGGAKDTEPDEAERSAPSSTAAAAGAPGGRRWGSGSSFSCRLLLTRFTRVLTL